MGKNREVDETVLALLLSGRNHEDLCIWDKRERRHPEVLKFFYSRQIYPKSEPCSRRDDGLRLACPR